jgi:NitT/TauT family transport system ATP-binding protein
MTPEDTNVGLDDYTATGVAEPDDDTRAATSPVKIAATGLERTFGPAANSFKALGPIDLTIAEGEFVSVVGPSGCGKSTLLRLVGGLLNPSSGGLDIYPRASSGTPTAIVFQDYSIFPWKTVRDNVRLGLDVARVPRREAQRRADHWIDRMGLGEFATSFPRTLSGGMKQRVAIARALCQEPEILLMDEPFAALDAQLRLVLQEELLELWEADRRTVLFITHSLDEAIVLSDRVIVMSARPGRVLADHAVPFPRPRAHELRGSAEFAAFQLQLWEELRTEIEATIRPRATR